MSVPDIRVPAQNSCPVSIYGMNKPTGVGEQRKDIWKKLECPECPVKQTWRSSVWGGRGAEGPERKAERWVLWCPHSEVPEGDSPRGCEGEGNPEG